MRIGQDPSPTTWMSRAGKKVAERRGDPRVRALVHRSRGKVPSTRPRELLRGQERALTSYTPEQSERLQMIHQRLLEARRELDALIGDAYLRPRASIVPVHFLDLASAVEKLRWAEKEWRELDKELSAQEADPEAAVGVFETSDAR